jgi:adenosylhomocysteine nucleosidase
MRPIAIMSAMDSEIADLRRELHPNPSSGDGPHTRAGRRDYYSGTLWGVPVVLAFSRWGKVAAASTALHLIHHYEPAEIIFTGVAGSIDPRTKVGDIVVATALVQHDMDASPLFERYELPLLGLSALPTTEGLRERLVQAANGFISNDFTSSLTPESVQRFNVQSPTVAVGEIASGDQFIASPEIGRSIKSRLPACLCVEMEGAAVAQVCYEHNVDFGVIRTISDRADSAADIDFPAFLAEVASYYSHGILRRLLTQAAGT